MFRHLLFLWVHEVNKVRFEGPPKFHPVCQMEVVSWFPCRFWCMYVNLCDYWVVVCFDWSCCIVCVALDDTVHKVFCAEDVVDSHVVACAMRLWCWYEHRQGHLHVMSS
jgi:hypothetical protein